MLLMRSFNSSILAPRPASSPVGLSALSLAQPRAWAWATHIALSFRSFRLEAEAMCSGGCALFSPQALGLLGAVACCGISLGTGVVCAGTSSPLGVLVGKTTMSAPFLFSWGGFSVQPPLGSAPSPAPLSVLRSPGPLCFCECLGYLGPILQFKK
jgi:hypothetical protein